MDYEGGSQTLETEKDLGPPPQSVHKRWLLELKLADKREREWRKTSEKILSRYRQEKAKKNSYNILWSNTETLRPALYNSLPKPDVRRRFKDRDPLGKAVSEVLRRSLEYQIDVTSFDDQIVQSVLDMLLPGRAVARVRYIPSLKQVGNTLDPQKETHEEGGEALQGDTEEVEWEQAPIEHVQWDDFRMGPGKTWDEIPWIAYRHRMTRQDLVDKFPDCGQDVPLDDTADDEVKADKDEKMGELFKTAAIWEIWDKDKRKVIFLSEAYKSRPLDEIDDPLNLVNFFPSPKPLYAIEDSTSMVPVPLYELYREQAEELDRISDRINKIIKGLKLRGIYDATLSELSELMRGEDNDLIPAANASAFLERGGIEAAIWFMPIEQAAKVLQILYEQREQAKQVVYDITGISDILRGSTQASETATAQQIKANWGNIRLKRMQVAIAAFIRDLMRLQAEIIAEKFQPETLQQMTGLQFPMMAQKQQAMAQYQQQAQMAQQQGQQPPQQPELPPAWEEILQVMRDDSQRTFKVDVETDSTIAASLETDMDGLQQTLQAISQSVQALGPLVQVQALPVEALKEIILSVCRRAKLGNAVEDALDNMQPIPPEQQQQDNSAQVAQMKAQSDAQLQQMSQQHEAQLEQMKMQADLQNSEKDRQLQAQIEQMKTQANAVIESARMDFEKWKAQLDSETQLALASITAQASLKQAEMSNDSKLKQTEMTAGAPAKIEQLGKGQQDQANLIKTAMENLQAKLDEMNEFASQPKVIERGPDGRAVSVGGRPITRDQAGRIAGLQ